MMTNPKLQIPNPNHDQIPNPKGNSQRPNPKLELKFAATRIGIWELGGAFGIWGLGVVGIWSLELGI